MVDELKETLPEIDNPNKVTLSEENIIFNLINDGTIEDKRLPISISNFEDSDEERRRRGISYLGLKLEVPDIIEGRQTEGICCGIFHTIFLVVKI